MTNPDSVEFLNQARCPAGAEQYDDAPERTDEAASSFEIESKTYCPPSARDKLQHVAANIAIIFGTIYGVLYSIVSMLDNGIGIGNVCGCIVAIAIGRYLFKTNRESRKGSHYEFCVLSTVFRENILTVTFLPYNNKEITIDLDSVKTLEYCDEIECLRLICNYEERDGLDGKNESSELLLYIPYAKNADFYQTLEGKVAVPLLFADWRH